MKRIWALLAALLLAQLASAGIVTYNQSGGNATNETNATEGNQTAGGNATNLSGFGLPDVNLSEVGDKLNNVTETGVGPIDQVTDFLMQASPYLLLIIGILLIVLSGFGKLIGIILVILAIIRLLWVIFA